MNNERNYGVDLLRIVATYMILVLHVLGQGGIIWTLERSSQNYEIAWLLEILAFCAVNCYALISGFVGVYKKFKLSNLLALWLQVVFISLVSAMIFYLCGSEVVMTDWIKACTPVISETYWYFTAYFCLFFLTPFLNELILKANKKKLGYLLVILFMLFSFVSTVFQKDIFSVKNGYSAIWLIVLYIVGGVIRKYYDEIKISKYLLILGYFCMILLTLCSKILIEFIEARTTVFVYDSFILIRYNSPTMIIASICLLLLFAQLSIKRIKRIITYVASFSFGIYIIHSEPYIWNHIMAGRFGDFKNLTSIRFVIAVLLAALIIFITCSLLEWFRISVFKLLHISTLCKKMERLIREHMLRKEVKSQTRRNGEE